MLSEEVDKIINKALSSIDIPEHLKVFDEFNDEARMMFACMLLTLGKNFITDKEKAVLKDWMKESAMMA